ncbi:hypothetical protein ACLB2K_042617 [Fragaria x ananassa]
MRLNAKNSLPILRLCLPLLKTPSQALSALPIHIRWTATINRLVTAGVPATVEHRAAAASSMTSSAAVVAECTQNFIKAMDSLKLNMIAVDQVHPLLSDLATSVVGRGTRLYSKITTRTEK